MASPSSAAPIQLSINGDAQVGANYIDFGQYPTGAPYTPAPGYGTFEVSLANSGVFSSAGVAAGESGTIQSLNEPPGAVTLPSAFVTFDSGGSNLQLWASNIPPGSVGPFTLTNTPGGAVATFDVSGYIWNTTTSSKVGTFTATFTATFDGETVADLLSSLPIDTPFSATITTSPLPTTLSITKTDNDGGSSVTDTSGTVNAGSQITYTVVVDNTGSVAADPVTVTDTMPSDISSDSWTATESGGASGYSASGTGGIDDTTVDLPASTSVTYTITATVSSSAIGTLSNTTSATAGNATTVSATDTDNVNDLTAGNSVTITAAAGTSTGTVVVGSFTDSNSTAPVSTFTATIDWGDGTSTTSGTIVQPGGVGTAFEVTGSHTYEVGGTYTLSIGVTGDGSATLSATADVSKAATTITTHSTIVVHVQVATVTFRATLTSETTGHGIQGQTITFALNGPLAILFNAGLGSGSSCVGTTNGIGVATCTLSDMDLGLLIFTPSYTAAFGGSTGYLASQANGLINVLRALL
jgi:uncharacterized repeat protein (TIGR01451 family)